MKREHTFSTRAKMLEEAAAAAIRAHREHINEIGRKQIYTIHVFIYYDLALDRLHRTRIYTRIKIPTFEFLDLQSKYYNT